MIFPNAIAQKYTSKCTVHWISKDTESIPPSCSTVQLQNESNAYTSLLEEKIPS